MRMILASLLTLVLCGVLEARPRCHGRSVAFRPFAASVQPQTLPVTSAISPRWVTPANDCQVAPAQTFTHSAPSFTPITANAPTIEHRPLPVARDPQPVIPASFPSSCASGRCPPK